MCFSLCSRSILRFVCVRLVRDNQLGHGLKEGKTYVLVKQSKCWRCAKQCGVNLRQNCSRRAAPSGAPLIPSNNTAREVANAKKTTVVHNTLSSQHIRPVQSRHGRFVFFTETSVKEMDWSGNMCHTHCFYFIHLRLLSGQWGHFLMMLLFICLCIKLKRCGHMGGS